MSYFASLQTDNTVTTAVATPLSEDTTVETIQPIPVMMQLLPVFVSIIVTFHLFL